MVFIIAQIFGIFAILFWLLCIQFKKKEDILELSIYSGACYALMFFLLKGYTAMIIDLITILRSVVFYKEEKTKKSIDKKWLYIFSILMIGAGVFTYDGLISLIPIITGIFYAVSAWYKDTKYLRVFYIICAILWIVYNVTYGAIIALIGNLFEIASGTISIIRFERKESKDGTDRKTKKINQRK